MKKLTKNLLLSASLLGMLSACAPKEDDKKSQNNGPLKVTATQSMEAAELADAGEQLVTPYTFMLADKVFAMALQNDPLNKKALLYKALLKPVMTYKGIATRIKPLARKYGSIGNLESSIEKIPKSPLRNFLVDGAEDITSDKQVQDLLVAQREAYNDLRLYFKNNSDVDMTLNLNPYIFGSRILENWSKSCRVVENGPNGLTVTCDSQDIATVKYGVADAVAAAQAVAGWVLFYDMYTAYSIEGVEKIYKQLENNPQLTPEQRQNLIESVPTIGKIRKDQKLSRIFELGADLAAAAKWAMQYQKELCPLGEGHENRPGYIGKFGICITKPDELTKNLALLEQGLGGALNLTIKDGAGNMRDTTINAVQFVKNPPADLRTIAPSAWCPNGKTPSALRDATFGGFYPKQDANVMILKPCTDELGFEND